MSDTTATKQRHKSAKSRMYLIALDETMRLFPKRHHLPFKLRAIHRAKGLLFASMNTPEKISTKLMDEKWRKVDENQRQKMGRTVDGNQRNTVGEKWTKISAKTVREKWREKVAPSRSMQV